VCFPTKKAGSVFSHKKGWKCVFPQKKAWSVFSYKKWLEVCFPTKNRLEVCFPTKKTGNVSSHKKRVEVSFSTKKVSIVKTSRQAIRHCKIYRITSKFEDNNKSYIAPIFAQF
jgi:hypothetical protein